MLDILAKIFSIYTYVGTQNNESILRPGITNILYIYVNMYETKTKFTYY